MGHAHSVARLNCYFTMMGGLRVEGPAAVLRGWVAMWLSADVLIVFQFLTVLKDSVNIIV